MAFLQLLTKKARISEPSYILKSKKRESWYLSKSRTLSEIKKAATYSPALHCSTIGDGGLNFSVRNGKRWDPAAITT